MNCEECQTQLPEYLDGVLSDCDRTLLEAHVEACAACAAALAGERKAMAQFQALLEPGVQQRRLSPAARDRLARINRPDASRGFATPVRRFPWIRPLAVAAAALILATGIGIVRHTLNQPPTSTLSRHAPAPFEGLQGRTNAFDRLIAATCMSNSQERFATAMNVVCKISM